MRFAHFFVDRPIFASVTSIVFLILGYVAYLSLPVAQYPEIVPPTVTVRASFPGANAETVAATIATPIEQEVNGVDNMLYMTSLSTNDGNMLLTVTFKVGTNLDIANVLVQNRLSVAQPRLPPDVRNLGVTVRKASPDLMLVVHLLSPKKTYDQNYLANYIYLNIRDELLRLDGVGDITIFGGNEYAERVWLDPNKLAAYGLTTSDVISSLSEQNVQVAAGALNSPPAATGQAFQLVVQSQGRFQSPEEFADVIVKASDGRLVRVKDVARVEMGQKDYTTNSFLNDTPAIGIGAFQRPGTNALDAAASVRKVMDNLKKNFPPDIEYRIAYNPTEFIEESIHEVYKTLFEAVGLVVIVVLVFLQSWRTALIPVIAIPVSLVGTFAAMSAFGFSLNNLTLFGLVLAIGIVVDDAIVVVENVERNMAEGLSPGDAAHKTMDEVGGAVIAIALVLSAVFIPTAFIPGITGQFYKQFALTIAASTIISMFNSLTLSPALCKLLLKPHHEHAKPKFFLFRFVAWLADMFNKGFDWLSNAYGRVIYGLTNYAIGLIAMMIVYAGVIAATRHLVQTTPTGFIPDQDQGYLIGVVQLPSGASLDRTTGGGEPGRGGRPQDRRRHEHRHHRGLRRRDLHQHHQFGRDVHHPVRRQGTGGQGAQRRRDHRRRDPGDGRHPGSPGHRHPTAAGAWSRPGRRLQDADREPAELLHRGRSSAPSARSWARPTRATTSSGCSPPSATICRSSTSTSTARWRGCSTCRSATSSPPCRRRSAVPTSTTSTRSAASIRCACRATRPSASRSRTSSS